MYWEKGTVVPFLDNDSYNGYKAGSGYFYRVKIDGSIAERPIACFPDKMRLSAPANKGGAIGEDRSPPKTNASAEAKKDMGQDAAGPFKVGDRVLASPLSIDDDKYFWKCTITGTDGLDSNYYNIRCDPQGGVSFKDYHVQPKWVRAWPDAEAAPTFDCSFDTPATVSNTAPPSPALFESVIYAQMSALEKAKVGMTFNKFQMGITYKNTITAYGLRRIGAPLNATIYTAKTQFTTCTEVITGDYNRRTVTKEDFGCYKDRFGHWICEAESTAEFLDRQWVLKKQK